MTNFGSTRAQLDAAVANVALQVDRDTVLEARRVLLAEAVRLKNEMQRVSAGPPLIGDCGADPISAEATPAFNQRITALWDHCAQYIVDLEESAHALDATARSYGWTEEEIAASFQPGQRS